MTVADATLQDSSQRLLDAIADKRAGRALQPATIKDIVADYVSGRVPDYQMAAWLATVACVGFDLDETAALTESYVEGGDRLSYAAGDGPVVDKHSTGGVGDKATLVVAPIVAACGFNVVKMSGRGLGHAGGTIDKLESVPGLRLDLDRDEVLATMRRAGMVITGQSAALAPGDGATYKLRDVTATVENIPFIAASIISKKLAVGADVVVLDVKVGEGALIPDLAGARELGRTMVDLGHRLGMRCTAVLTDMSEPMGRAVGNALEVREAVDVLRGADARGLSAPCKTLAVAMLQGADPSLSADDAARRIDEVIADGTAYERFADWLTVQGAHPGVLEDPAGLPVARHVSTVTATSSGHVHRLSPRMVGSAAVRVGAGRLRADDRIDHASGVIVCKRVGDYVARGEVLAELHHSDDDPHRSLDQLRAAFQIAPEPIAATDPVHEVIS